MKRVIISNEDLPTQLPSVLAININQQTHSTVNELMTALKEHFPEESDRIIGVRTYS